LEPVSERGRRLAVTLEALQKRRSTDQVSLDELQKLRDISLEAGQSSLVSKLDVLQARLSGGTSVTTGELIGTLDRQARELERGRLPSVGASYGASLEGQASRLPPTRDELEMARILREQVELMKKSLEEQQKTNQKLDNPTSMVTTGL
jgi:hypothetical protein